MAVVRVHACELCFALVCGRFLLSVSSWRQRVIGNARV